jgi:ketosteroid isomerase-like protein
MSAEETVAREHIRDRMARYNIARDSDDLPAFLDCFTEDVVFEAALFCLRSKAEIEAFYGDKFYPKAGTPVPRFRRHHLSTCQIDLTGPTTANARTYYAVYTDLGVDHCGVYADRFRVEKGRWLIAHRATWMDWCHPSSLYVPEGSKRVLSDTGLCGPASGFGLLL